MLKKEENAMSKVQLEEFYKKIAGDTRLKEKVMAIKGNAGEVYEKVTAIAREEGFEVEKNDFVEAFNETADLEKVPPLELGDSNCGGDPGCTRACTEVCGSFMGHYVGKQ